VIILAIKTANYAVFDKGMNDEIYYKLQIKVSGFLPNLN